MSCYKSIEDLGITWYSNVIKEFIKGIRLYKSPGNVIEREELCHGSTKYNLEILRRLKKIQKDYRYVISIESAIIHFVQNYTKENRMLTGNVWNLMVAQKKTVGFINVFIDALKQYAVKDKDLYACINKWIRNLEERADRNLKFTEEHMEQFGLLTLVGAIKEEYGITVYEYIDQLFSEFISETQLKKSDKNFYTEMDLFVYENLNFLAKKHGIDICDAIKKAEHSMMDRMNENKAKAMATKSAQKKMEKQRFAYQLNAKDNMQIYHSIENADDRIQECGMLIQALKTTGGKIWYLTAVRGSRLYYITSDMTLTSVIGKAALFPSKNSDEMKNIISAYGEKHSNDIVSVQYLDLPENLPGYEQALAAIEAIDPVKIELEAQERGLYMTLTDSWDISQIWCCSLEFELMKNNGNIYAVCLVKKNASTTESYWIPENWNKDKGLEPSVLTKAVTRTRWYHTEKEAQEVVSEIKNGLPDNMSAHVIHLEYHGPYKIHDYIMEECINKTIKSISAVIKNGNRDEVGRYFNDFSDFMQFTDAINASPACIIVSEECTGNFAVRYVQDRKTYSHSDDMLTPYIKNPAMAGIHDKDGMERLKKLCWQLYRDHGKRRIYCIVKFWKTDDRYDARVVYMPWEECHEKGDSHEK